MQEKVFLSYTITSIIELKTNLICPADILRFNVFRL